MFGIGIWELLVILLVVLVIFGPRRLPELGRALGKGLAEFRKATSEIRGTFDAESQDTKKVLPDNSKPGEQETTQSTLSPTDQQNK